MMTLVSHIVDGKADHSFDSTRMVVINVILSRRFFCILFARSHDLEDFPLRRHV